MFKLRLQRIFSLQHPSLVDNGAFHEQAVAPTLDPLNKLGNAGQHQTDCPDALGNEAAARKSFSVSVVRSSTRSS